MHEGSNNTLTSMHKGCFAHMLNMWMSQLRNNYDSPHQCTHINTAKAAASNFRAALSPCHFKVILCFLKNPRENIRIFYVFAEGENISSRSFSLCLGCSQSLGNWKQMSVYQNEKNEGKCRGDKGERDFISPLGISTLKTCPFYSNVTAAPRESWERYFGENTVSVWDP